MHSCVMFETVNQTLIWFFKLHVQCPWFYEQWFLTLFYWNCLFVTHCYVFIAIIRPFSKNCLSVVTQLKNTVGWWGIFFFLFFFIFLSNEKGGNFIVERRINKKNIRIFKTNSNGRNLFQETLKCMYWRITFSVIAFFAKCFKDACMTSLYMHVKFITVSVERCLLAFNSPISHYWDLVV